MAQKILFGCTNIGTETSLHNVFTNVLVTILVSFVLNIVCKKSPNFQSKSSSAKVGEIKLDRTSSDIQ